MVVHHRIYRHTHGNGDMHDLTPEVAACVHASKVTNGTITVFVVGSTAAIGTIEFEPGLQRDLPEALNRLMPPNRSYGHEQAWHDGNGHSHLQATLMGPSITMPVENGTPHLGTWQQIFLLECDIRDRRREVVVTVVGE